MSYANTYNLTATQFTSPLRKETLIKPQNHNLFNNPSQYYSEELSIPNSKISQVSSPKGQNNANNNDSQISQQRDYFSAMLNRQPSKIQPFSTQQSQKEQGNIINPEIINDDQNNYPSSKKFKDRTEYVSSLLSRNNKNNNRDTDKSSTSSLIDFKTNPKESQVQEEQSKYDQNYKMFSPHAASVFDIREDILMREGTIKEEMINEEDEKRSQRSKIKARQAIFTRNQIKAPPKRPFTELIQPEKQSSDVQSQLFQDNFLKYIHPKQRETIYLLFGEKRDHWQKQQQIQAGNQGGLSRHDTGGSNESQKREQKRIDEKRQQQSQQGELDLPSQAYYQKLDQRAELLKDRLRDTSKVISHMMERRRKFLIEHEELIKSIETYKDTIEIAQKTPKRKVFERDIQLLVEQIKLAIQDLKDKYREANDLIVIFSIASNHYLSEGARSSMKNINTLEEIKSNAQIPVPSNNMLDFDSRALQIYEEFQQQIRNLDAGLNEYKKYLKLDPEGEEFNLRTQELLIILKQCESFTSMAEQEIVLLNQELGVNLKEIAISLMKNVEFYQRVYLQIEESFGLVSKMLYLGKWKFKELEEKIAQVGVELDQHVQRCCRKHEAKRKGQTRGWTPVEFEDSKKGIRLHLNEIQDICCGLRKEIYSLASDPRCQYFIQVRFKQCNKLLFLLDNAQYRVSTLEKSFEFVSTTLEPELVEAVSLQSRLSFLQTRFKEINIDNKKREELFKGIYLESQILSADIGSACCRLSEPYSISKMLSSLQKCFHTLKIWLEGANNSINELQSNIEVERLKKGRSEQQEHSIRRLEELSRACVKEIDQFNNLKETAFFNFQEAERYHTSAMVALGSARQAFQIIKEDKEGVVQELSSQFVKQISSQKNSLELANCIFDNISYLQIQNFKSLVFSFKMSQEKGGAVPLFDTNLDELLQGVDESLKNIKQVWESVKKQPFEKFLNDVTEKLVKCISGLNDFVSFWLKGCKILVKSMISRFDTSSQSISEYDCSQLIHLEIDPFCNFLQERIKRSLDPQLGIILNALEEKVRECCVSFCVFICKGEPDTINSENFEKELSNLEACLLNRDDILSFKYVDALRQIVTFTEQQVVDDETLNRIKVLRIISSGFILADFEQFSNQSNVKNLILLDIVKQLALPEDATISASKNQKKEGQIGQKSTDLEALQSSIDLSLHLASRITIASQIRETILNIHQSSIQLQDILGISKTNINKAENNTKQPNQNNQQQSLNKEVSFFTTISKYSLFFTKQAQLKSKLISLASQSPYQIQSDLELMISQNQEVIENELRFKTCTDLPLLFSICEAGQIYQQTLGSPPFIFLLEYHQSLSKFRQTIQLIADTLTTLKEASFLTLLQSKYLLPNTPIHKGTSEEPEELIMRKPIGLFTKITGFSQAIQFKDSVLLDNWIKIISSVNDNICNPQKHSSNYKQLEQLIDSLEALLGLEDPQLLFIRQLRKVAERK